MLGKTPPRHKGLCARVGPRSFGPLQMENALEFSPFYTYTIMRSCEEVFMKKGFTLIELLVVVLIIGVLSSVALPQYQKAVERARATEAVMDMGILAQAVERYVLENDLRSDITTDIDLEDLDVQLPNSTKFSFGASCNPGQCFVWVTQVADNYALSAYQDNGQWIRTCTYKTSLGKGVCDSLIGSGYTSQEYVEVS